jgi:hypothetical protein
MVAPGVLTAWAMSTCFRGNGIPFRDDDARDAPFAGAIGLTTPYIDGRDARLRNISVHTTPRMAGMVSYVRAQPTCGLQNLHRPSLFLSMAEPGHNIHVYVPT